MIEKYNENLNVRYKVVTDKNGISEINLRKLLTESYDDQPWLVDTVNCIYLVTNLLNGKVYVGQTSWLYGRFSDQSKMGHLGGIRLGANTRLYNSIRLHGSRNYKVEVLSKDLSDLNSSEIYFISYFNSFSKERGYNMTSGGENCENLYNGERQANRLIEYIKYHDDYLKEHHLELTPVNYLYNVMDSYSARRHISRVLNWIDYLRLHPEWNERFESLFKWFEENGIPKDGFQNQTIMINTINRYIDYLKSEGLEVNPFNYSRIGNNVPRFHIPNVIYYIEYLRFDLRWTEEMESLFNYFMEKGVPYE